MFIFMAQSALAGTSLSVFVSILPEQYFVEQIGGQHVEVHVLVGPGHSPATFEPTPRQLASLALAHLYFRIGVDFEQAWMERLAAVNPAMKVVDLREGILLRTMERPPGVGLSQATRMKDPHIWTDPRLAKVMARHICDALNEADPADRNEYEGNYAVLAGALDRLDSDIRATLAPLTMREFITFHPAWGYFADAYGLKQIPIEAEGKEPGPKTLAALIDFARRQHIHVIFVQQQFSRRTAETIARTIGARVVAIDPLAEDYPDNLRRVAAELAGAMESR
jgi:zinc transport system substrate-binding protein